MEHLEKGGVGGLSERERGSVFKQMGEMKKKIQLVEGERKAVYEDCENEKNDNREKVKKMKEEIRELQGRLRDSTASSEPVLKHVQGRRYLQLNVLKKKSGEDAVEYLDYNVADLRKKLNKLRYETKCRSGTVDGLVKEYGKACEMKAEKEKVEELIEDSEEGQRLRFLENEIHKTNLKLMEGETIKKKYNSILDMLKRERLTFSNQLESLESQIKKQENEIERLKKTHAGALVTRDLARTNQHRREISLLMESKEREKRLHEYRKTAEERKNYFESMERHMFASKTSVKETGRESISTDTHAHSSASKEDGRTSEDGHGSASETDNIKDDAYEEAFGRMKKAAGVSDVDEVVRRFETQEETATHLQELQARAEKEIRDLGAVKERLESEWETVKFMGQEENTELRDNMEDLEDKIAEEQDRKRAAEEKLLSRNKLLAGIREGLEKLTEKLFLFDESPVPTTRNSIELLTFSRSRLTSLASKVDGVNMIAVKLQMEEDEFVAVGIDLGLTPGAAKDMGIAEDEKDDKKEDVDSGPEEEEVPTRGYLKRQANLIVDAKSRSKRGNRRR